MGRAMKGPDAGQRTSVRARIALAAMLAGLAAGCLFPSEKTAGRGSEVETEVYGVMVDRSGGTVVGARVRAYPADPAAAAVPAEALDSAVTDGKGGYRLRALQPGAYNLVGEHQDGKLAVLIPEVRYALGPAQDLGTDTLLAPGAIEGRILLGTAGKSGVMAYVPGTSFLAISDANGAFAIGTVPKGRYRVNYRIPGFAAAPDTGVNVESGQATRLPDKVLAYDTAQPPPAPASLGAVFDTLGGLVRLHWSPVAIGDLLGYKVYRDAGPLSLPVPVSGLVADTQFIDSLHGIPALGTVPRDLGYRIRTIDRELNEGMEYSPQARIGAVSQALVTTGLALSIDGPSREQAGIGQTVLFKLVFSNPTRRVSRIEWFRDGLPAGASDQGSRGGADSLALSWTDPGLHAVEVKAIDDAAAAWTATLEIEVIVGEPEADAGKDTTVSLGDIVELRPTARDRFGTVARWEWDIGVKGLFREAPLGVLDFTAPAMPMEEYPCILRVIDDEGNRGYDTLSVRVLADPPTAKASLWPLEAFVGDTVTLSAEGSSDGMGSIVRWEWDIGKRGAYVASADGSFRLPGAPSADSILPCVLRVTDDDGQTDTAEIKVVFRGQEGWPLWTRGEPMTGIRHFHCLAFGGKAWLFGNYDTDSLGRSASLWNTSDMIHWERFNPAPLPRIDLYVRPVAHAGALYLAGTRPFGLQPWDQRQFCLWRTVDGTAWDSLPAPASLDSIRFMVLASHAGRIWALCLRDTLGAQGWSPGRSEIWSTPDGLTWTRVTDKAPYGIRLVVSALSWNGRLWIYGNAWSSDPAQGNDLWSTADGVAWRRESSRIFPGMRGGVSMFVHQDALWMYSDQEAPSNQWGEIMRSRDGVSWAPVQAPIPLVSDYGYARTMAFGGRVWLLLSVEDRNRRQQWEIRRGPW
jgi:hypothetical protein